MYNDFSEMTLPEYISVEQCNTEKLMVQVTLMNDVTFWFSCIVTVCIFLSVIIVCIYDCYMQEKRMSRLEEKIDELCSVQEKVRTV